MARGVTLKRFYVGLGAIAVIGVGAIMFARSGASGGPVDAGPVPVGAAGDFDGYVMGSDSAPVEIIEYADFECPACATFALLYAPDVKRRLVETGRARLIFRDFPLPQHQKAPVAHHAAACAAEQGQFWPMHDQLYGNHGRWVNDRRPERVIEQLAEALGLDMRRYDECMDSGRYRQRIQASRERGSQLGVGSTPSFIVGGRLVAGTGVRIVDQLEALVTQARTRETPVPQ